MRPADAADAQGRVQGRFPRRRGRSARQQVLGDETAGAGAGRPAVQRDHAREPAQVGRRSIPQPDEYNFEPADRYVEFGEKQRHVHRRPHAGVAQPDARLGVRRATTASRSTARRSLERMKRPHPHGRRPLQGPHQRLGRRQRSASTTTARCGRRTWQRIIGDDYIEKAFQFAHEADPDAELYYNDYNRWKPGEARTAP